MTGKQKKILSRIIVAAVLMIVLHFLPVSGLPLFFLYLIPYLIIGHDILRKAWKGIVNRQVFDENFLMAVATVGALAIGLLRTGDYEEAVAVMLFYQIGELFQSLAVGRSRRSISELMDIRPDHARVEADGQLTDTDPDEVEVGSVIVVDPGERIPLDGTVISGESSINTSALTGESVPRDVKPGDEVNPPSAGCLTLSRTPAPAGPAPRISSPALPAGILPLWYTGPLRSRLCRPWSACCAPCPRTGASGYTAR